MDKNKTNEAFSDIQRELLSLYGELKWILASKRGKKFQFMMLDRTFEAYISCISRIRERNTKDNPNTQEHFPDLLEFK
jgi:hypothetical protein